MLRDARDVFIPHFDRPAPRDALRGASRLRVRLDHPIFGGQTPHCAALFGQHGLKNLCPTLGGDFTYVLRHPNHQGVRRNHATMVADFDGPTDDRLQSTNSVPCIGPTGTANYQTIFGIYQPFWYSSSSYGHGMLKVGAAGIQFRPEGQAIASYLGGGVNPNRRYFPMDFNRPNTVAMSIDKIEKVILGNVNGVGEPTSSSGNDVDIGGGFGGNGDGPCGLSGGEQANNVAVNPNGNLYAFFAGNGFLNEAQLAALVRDPFGELLEPDYGRTIYLPATSAGETVVGAGIASETNEALGVSWSKRKAVGLAAESDSAPAATARRTVTAGLATETDSALGLLPAKRLATGLASESDSALSATARRTIATGLASETDSAPALAAAKRKAVGLATETDTAPALTAQIGAAIGLAQETDEALAAAAMKRKTAGLATEADTAPAVTARRTVAAGLATESDAALAARVARAFAAGLAVEADAALALAWAKRKGIGLAVETDTALALVPISRPSTLPPRRVVSARPDRTLRSARPDRTHVTRN